MSDFFLDLRKLHRRPASFASERLRHFADLQSFEFEGGCFSLAVTRCDDPGLWSPYRVPQSPVTVALVGRIAMEPDEWEKARSVEGSGGLACKAIWRRYSESGRNGLTGFNGNFSIVIVDESIGEVFVITDRCGAAPVFTFADTAGVVLSSHPDLLAASSDQSSKLDEVSLAEFLSTGKVSFPNSYYSTIKALEAGTVYSIAFDTPMRISGKKYFQFQYVPASGASEEEIAVELADAFRNSVRRRTLPLFGLTAVALSGGLDSRTILAGCPVGGNVKSFCFYDEENFELSIAKRIARTLGVEMIPFRRDFEHYGGSAEMAIRIYGGMGSFANNHFLGFRSQLAELGADNILTGFYCDYLFKGLAQNLKKNRYLRTEALGGFSLPTYRPMFWFETKAGMRARARMEDCFPHEFRQYATDKDRLEIESRRIFPLAYEPDNAEATVPQRVMPWFLPIVDNQIIDVYLRIPPRMKPNASVYSKMVAIVTGPEVTGIPDANTGSPVDASLFRQCLSRNAQSIRERIRRRLSPRIATSDSWPNWNYYAAHSKKLEELWLRKTPGVEEMFSSLLGFDPFEKPIQQWAESRLELFLRLLTLKVWLEVRIAS